MNATFIEVPKFHPTQVVRFIGGQGIVRSYKFELGTWTYVVEMTMGIEPNFGRVGSETMVLLDEADLSAA